VHSRIALLSVAFALYLVSVWGDASKAVPIGGSDQPTSFFAASGERSPSSKTHGVIDEAHYTLERDQDGLFRIDASVGSKTINFVLDTGATHVFLSQADAEQIGLNWAPGASGEIETATGSEQVRWVIAPTIQIAGHELKGLQVGIVAGKQSLLGQQGLRQLGRLTIEPTHLTLEK